VARSLLAVGFLVAGLSLTLFRLPDGRLVLVKH
jgi:hypothetical protein